MAEVVAVAKSVTHGFSKQVASSIDVLAGEGVSGDCHSGVTVKHRSRVVRDPTQPNLRQVHLIHSELFDELATQGYTVGPAVLGENITTRGIDLLALPQNALLHIGSTAVVEITGLRNPCQQIDDFQAGLVSKVLIKEQFGNWIRKTGVMGIVKHSGSIFPGDEVVVELPAGQHIPLEKI
jgi:MOSC domain-containing protein YiiM